MQSLRSTYVFYLPLKIIIIKEFNSDINFVMKIKF